MNDDDLSVDLVWLQQVLNNEIESIDWKQAAIDVERFLNIPEQKSLTLWSEHFFMLSRQRMFNRASVKF